MTIEVQANVCLLLTHTASVVISHKSAQVMDEIMFKQNSVKSKKRVTFVAKT